MSIGNLKTEGNKGNNFPYQLKVLQGLQAIADNTNNNEVEIIAPLGFQGSATSVSVSIANDQAKLGITPNILISSGDTATVIISSSILSISFASNGTADALISFDGGTSYAAIPTGTTINLDAGGIMNRFVQDTFAYDTDTNGGASLIITYNTI
jgi:hypothetical protein